MKTGTRISEIIYEKNSRQPILGNFQNGVFGGNTNCNSLAVDVLEDTKNKKHFAALSVNNHLYAGDIKKNENFNNFIAIKRPNSNKMILIAVDNCLLSAVIPSKKPAHENDTEKSVVTKGELNKQFGSKKSKRMTEQYERMKMNINNATQVLEETAANVVVNEAELVVPEISGDDFAYKPPINRYASTVENVYNINDLLPLNISASMADIDSVLEMDEATIRQNLYPLISDEVMRIINGKSSKEKLPALIYVDCLIKMLLAQSRVISTKKFNPSPNFYQLGLYILDNFTFNINNNRTRPISMRDKTICHIIVILAITLNYKLDIELLSKLLKIGVKKLLEISRSLGFTPTKNKEIELKLPLPQLVSVAKGKRRS